ncbi:MAG: hypothetical protein AAF628_26860 [Planctomycetota bacterium]
MRPRKYWFTRTFPVLPNASVTGVVAIFGRNRTWIDELRLGVSINGGPWRTLARVSRGKRQRGEIVFVLSWAKEHEAIHLGDDAKVQVRGWFQGAPPTEVKGLWLGANGDPFDPAKPPSTDTAQALVFDERDAGSLLDYYDRSARALFSDRLKRLLAREPSRERDDAAFFYDLDISTHLELLPTSQRQAMRDLCEDVFDRVRERAQQPAQPYYQDKKERERLRESIDPIRWLFDALLCTHFEGESRSEYDGGRLRRAITGFVLGDHVDGKSVWDDTLGMPDSAYYFCFAEAIILFVDLNKSEDLDLNKSEELHWKPALEAFVDSSKVFAKFYRHPAARRHFDSYRIDHGRNNLQSDPEGVAQARKDLLSPREPRTWGQVVTDFGKTVAEAFGHHSGGDGDDAESENSSPPSGGDTEVDAAGEG